MPCFSMSSPEIAATDSGISKTLSSLFLAVTVISSITAADSPSMPSAAALSFANTLAETSGGVTSLPSMSNATLPALPDFTV